MEIERPNSYTHGEKDTDYVLTTTELIRMIRTTGVEFSGIEPESTDMPFGIGSGGGVIFGVTGGVTEAVLRRLVPVHDKAAMSAIAESGVRGDHPIKEVTVNYQGRDVRICVVNGLANAKIVMDKVRSGEADYDLIEVMACRRGCIMGGGQPMHAGPRTKVARMEGIYRTDKSFTLKKSDENPLVHSLYGSFLKGREHELLHNEFY